jgi:hypothetical protein
MVYNTLHDHPRDATIQELVAQRDRRDRNRAVICAARPNGRWTRGQAWA